MLMRDKLHSESSNHVEMNLESPRHVNVRDWLNLARGNIVIDPSGNSNISRGELFLADSPKVAGIKRHRYDSNQSPTSDKSTIEDIVHARKKYEIVHEKSNEHALCDKKQSDVIKEECIPRCTLPLESFFPSISGERLTLPSVSSLKTTCKDKVSVPSISTCQTACIDQTVTLKSSFYSNYPTKPNHRFPMESNETIMTTDSPDLVNRHEVSNLYWKDRFLQVQTFLKACDESSQEDYIQSKLLINLLSM